jgi:hypothetical protein
MLTPAQIEDYASAATMATTNQLELAFLDAVRHVNREHYDSQLNPGRPIPDAADEIAETARVARAMLEAVQAGWLWQILTIQLEPKD